MGRRIYVGPLENLSLTNAAQDLITAKASATKGLQLHHLQMTCGGVTAAVEIRMQLKRLPATVTVTGGTSVTVGTVDSGDTLAVTATLTSLNTTIATSTGTIVIAGGFQWNLLMPFDYMPGPEDEDRDACLINEAFALNLPAAPGAAYSISGFLKFRELP